MEPGPKNEYPTTLESGLDSGLVSGDGTPRPFTQASEPELGTRLGQFRVEGRIGRGGRGVVYRAYDEKLKRPVALKVLLETASGASAAGLLEEARAAAALTHPCIAAIHDVQQQEGVVFIVMELVQGETLRVELRRGPIPIPTAARYARDIASGLARAHRSGVVHRDLKPENVMITPEGNAKILDFGLARTAPEVAPPSGDAGLTGIAGTPGYMAPEQARGRRVDARADVFSFGIVLWEMVTGKRPFPRDTWTPPEPLSRVAPNVPRDWVRVTERCLALEPSDRFMDAVGVAEALRSIEEPSPAQPGRRRRNLNLMLLGGAIVLGAGAVVFGSSWGSAGHASGGGEGALPTAPAPKGKVLALTSTPERLTNEDLCSTFPDFADDGSIVFSQQDPKRVEIHRLDLATGKETALTDDGSNSLHPSAGPSGQAVYLFRKKGDEGVTEVRSVPLTGGKPTLLVHGSDPAFARGTLFFLQEDGRAIRARTSAGAEDLLYEAPSASIFGPIAVSQDGRWLATEATSTEPRPADTICYAPLGGDRVPLDCTSAGLMTSRRAAFPPSGDALYFARGETIVRYDLKAHTTESVPISPAPTTLTIAPDSASVVFSTCRARYEAYRLARDGQFTALPKVTEVNAGTLAVGPAGELAFPVARGLGTVLAFTDASAERIRVLTNEEHSVTESAFSPDGRRIAFHDESPDAGGLFVIEVAGTNEKVRVTTDSDDGTPSWIDEEHLVYSHPEKGLPHGRVYMVAAAGGEPVALPKVPGIFLGAIPSRRTLLLGITSPSGDRFAEATLEGKVKDIRLRGVPSGMHWQVMTSVSPSGHYAAWFSGAAAWVADFDAGTASGVEFHWPRPAADMIQTDDQGRITVSFRYGQGQLYRVRGSFP